MRRLVQAALCLTFALAVCFGAGTTCYVAAHVNTAQLHTFTEEERVARVQADVVDHYVNLQDAGAGTLVDVKGKLFVLTADHVATYIGKKPGTIYTFTIANGQEIRTLFQRSSPLEPDGCDMALYLVVDCNGISAARLAPRGTAVVPGEVAFHIGTPWGFHRRLDRGSIDSGKFEFEGAQWNLFSGHGWFGSSGGSLYVWRVDGWVLAGVTNRITDQHFGACLMSRQTDVMLDFLEGK